MRICLPGGAGSGGSFLVEELLRKYPDCEITIPVRWHSNTRIDNLSKVKDKVTIKECDLNDLSSVIRLLKECNPDVVYNMAAHANVRACFEIPLAVLQNNIFSTANLLEGVRLVCPQTIFQQCSTSEVCGTPKTMPITEEHELNPSNPYAVSKLAGEKLAYAYWKSYGIKVIITRAFCYANSRRHDLFATAFALQIAKIEQRKQDILTHGNLRSIRTIMSVKDMSEAYIIASEKCEIGTPYNLGATDPISVGDFLNILIRKAKCYIPTEQDAKLLRPSDITNQVPDCSKFFNRTGWKPKYSIEDCADFLLEEARKTVSNE